MRKGDVLLINLDPTIGAEIKKTRPAVIVSEDAIGVLPLKVAVPVTDWKDGYGVAPWMVRLDPRSQNKSDKTSAADCLMTLPTSTTELNTKATFNNLTNESQEKKPKTASQTIETQRKAS